MTTTSPPGLVLNDAVVALPASDAGLLAWLRERGLTAAKPTCLGGDCGACQVLVGSWLPGDDAPTYRAVTSCLLTTRLVEDCHVITVEGLDAAAPTSAAPTPGQPTPVQTALVEAGAIQCGFCTPGLVIALTAGLLAGVSALDAAAGTLCRCTGYGGVRRACERLDAQFAPAPRTLAEAAALGIVPDAVARAGATLRPLRPDPPRPGAVAVGGHTDEALAHPAGPAASTPRRLRRSPDLRGVTRDGDALVIGAATTVAEVQASQLVARAWPALPGFLDRFGSPAIRGLATVGGNLAHASPVADLAVVLLALDAQLTLEGPDGRRELPLSEFFLAYRRTALRPDELIVTVRVPANDDGAGRLHAEKVSRRIHDDIASVNSTMVVTGGDERTLGRVVLSAGGVAPVPALLARTAAALSGCPLDPAPVRAALGHLAGEVAPIDDVRGSASYKARLLRHVVLAHLAALHPGFDPWAVLP